MLLNFIFLKDIGKIVDRENPSNKISLLTVTIGSKGPKISSFIMRESLGASNIIVGAILLEKKVKLFI